MEHVRFYERLEFEDGLIALANVETRIEFNISVADVLAVTWCEAETGDRALFGLYCRGRERPFVFEVANNDENAMLYGAIANALRR